MAALLLPVERPVVVFARVAPGRVRVPGRMMRPGPLFSDRAASHRLESPRLCRGPFINVYDEPREHHQRRYVVQHVTDCHRYSPEHLREPHYQPREQEDRAASDDGPEVELLAGVKEPYEPRLDL